MKDEKILMLFQSFERLINEYGSVYESISANEDWKNPFRDLISIEIPELIKEFLKTEYLSLKECMSEDANFQVLCDKLEEINLILAKAGSHVGYRVRDEIVFYLLNNKKNGLLSAEEAFDNEVMQKILPRIQGSSTSVKNMLCALFRYCAGDYIGLGGNSDSEQMQA